MIFSTTFRPWSGWGGGHLLYHGGRCHPLDRGLGEGGLGDGLRHHRGLGGSHAAGLGQTAAHLGSTEEKYFIRIGV